MLLSLANAVVRRHVHEKPDGSSVLSVRLTPERIAGAILATTLALLAVVGAGRLGVEFSLLRPVLATLVLSLVPGYLLLKIVGVRPGNLAEFTVYVVGVSLAVVMFYGATINFLLLFVGYQTPISEIPIALAICGGVLALLPIYLRRVDEPTVVSVRVDTIAAPWFPFVLLFPFMAIYGAHFLNVYDNNVLLLVLYASIALTAVLVVYDVIPTRYLPLVIWLIAISMLLQNTLTGQFLAWGDQENEASQAMHVVSAGYWDHIDAPSSHINQYSMIRISILHPIYLLLADVEIFWVFRAIYPFLLSVMPVALYQAYGKYVTGKEAFLATFLYISLFSFFTVLSRNTRTGTALLFFSILLLLITDRDVSPGIRKALAVLFASSIVVSHYGTSYMILIGLVAALSILLVLTRWSLPVRKDVLMTTGAFVALYVTVAYSWYTFASPQSWPYFTLIEFVDDFIHELQDEFLYSPDETSASTRYAVEAFDSITLNVLRYYNMFVGFLIGIGMLSIGIKTVLKRETPFDLEYVTYAAVFLGIFAITFLPIARFNTARTFATTLLVFAPFFLFGIYAFRDAISWRFTFDIERQRVLNVAAAIVVIYFLLNSGFIAATVTHEYSPNVLVEKDRVMDDGHPAEADYFYKQHPTEQDVRATIWLRTQAEPESDVYEGLWPGNMWGPSGYEEWSQEYNEQRVSVNTHRIDPEEPVEGDYVYLGSLGYRSNVISIAHGGHFGLAYEHTDELEYKWGDKSKIYTNGNAAVYG